MPLVADDLLLHAEALAGSSAPSQADLRRAISAAYYAVFHLCMTAAADMVAGVSARSTAGYSLVYRSVDHRALRALCIQLGKSDPQNVAITPPDGFGNIADFARVTANLYEQRISADYEPSRDFTVNETTGLISAARQAASWFRSSTKEQQDAFSTMLLFKQR